jgi:CRISPR/Cas system CMR subunit Cmr6 (Cas7 group RAMP superfamily)
MCEKLADHQTTVDVGMFNSCFHLEPASQDRDILEVNLCTPHYQKYKIWSANFSHICFACK